MGLWVNGCYTVPTPVHMPSWNWFHDLVVKGSTCYHLIIRAYHAYNGSWDLAFAGFSWMSLKGVVCSHFIPIRKWQEAASNNYILNIKLITCSHILSMTFSKWINWIKYTVVVLLHVSVMYDSASRSESASTCSFRSNWSKTKILYGGIFPSLIKT